MGYDGERADTPVVDQLEAILRGVAEELAGWRARALKAETDLKELRGGAGGGPTRLDPEVRNRLAELEQENKTLRQRVEGAKLRVHDLLGRLTFLEEQTQRLVDALGNLDVNTLGDMVEGPMGPTPRLAIAQLPATHMMYHDGQLNYIQTLYGDKEMHWG